MSRRYHAPRGRTDRATGLAAWNVWAARQDRVRGQPRDRERVRADERLRDLWVEGEVGRVTISSAGHAYFALKDERAQLQCVWFRDERVRSPFQPQTGLRVVAHGRVDVYEAQGALQLYVDSIQPSGVGDLAIRFEQLKAKLAAEGLFDAERKRPLPLRPRGRSPSSSSPTGAVVEGRLPRLRAALAAGAGRPRRVPGPGRRRAGVDRAARCGGSSATSTRLTAAGRADEAPGGHDPRPGRRLARGPVVVQRRAGRARDRRAHAAGRERASGHEVDVTLADFAADVRAATPSAAAELVVPDRAEFASALAARRRADAASRGGARRLVAASRELEAERRRARSAEPGGAARRRRASAPADLLDRATRRRRALARGVPRSARARPRRCCRSRWTPSTRLDGSARGAAGAWRCALDAGRRGRGARSTARPAGDARARLRDRPPAGDGAHRAATRREAPAGTRPARLDAGRRATSPRPADARPRVPSTLTIAATDPRSRRRPSRRPRPTDAGARRATPRPSPSTRPSPSSSGPSRSSRPAASRWSATIALYERGVALHDAARALLAEAELRVQQLVARAGGALAAVDVRPEDAAEE